MKNIILAIAAIMICLAGSAFAQEHLLEITRAEQNQKSIARGEIIPGVIVNEDKEVKVGRKLNVGDRVFVPKDVRVTFESSNTNKIETINNAEFIVSNITNKGEVYYQLFGKIRYIVIPKAMEFFNVYHTRYSVGVDGTVFSVNVDLENKEIEFTAEQKQIAVTREYKVKVRDNEIKGLEEIEVVSDKDEKQQSVKYKLDVDEASQVFESNNDVLAYFRENLKKYEQQGNNRRVLMTENNIGCTLLSLARYDEAIKHFEKILKKKEVSDKSLEAGKIYSNLGTAWYSKGENHKAMEYYDKALNIFIKYLGEKHPVTDIVKKKY